MPGSTASQGVGGRQPIDPLLARGGGYQDICTISKPSFRGSEDPRIDFLKKIGLSDLWIEIAEVIGFDDFIYIWRILDRDNIGAPSEARATNRVRVPGFNRFHKFLRNKLILQLSQSGKKPAEIKAKLHSLLRENISARHVVRIIQSGQDAASNEQ